jgi:hypothetical protein
MPACDDGQAHWFVVESPSGKPVVMGICKRCGLEKAFPTTGVDDWDNKGWQASHHIPNMKRAEPTKPFWI